MKILVADGHAEADFLIGSLLEKKHKVVVINSDRPFSKYLAETHEIPVINGDASKKYILDEAKVKGFDLVVALGENDANNLVVCQTAKKMYSIHKAVAIVSNPKSVEVFKRLGVNTAISSAYLVAKSIEQASNIENLSNSLSLAQGSVAVSEISIDTSCPVCKKRLTDLRFTDELNISCIVRGSETIIPRGDTRIENGDLLIVVTDSGKKERVAELLTGKKQES